MQKKLIALAVATAFSGAAFAQSNVTISGKVVAGFEQYKVTGAAAGTETATENRITDSGSRLIFNGTENLGGGLSAVFQVDNRFNVDTVQDTVGTTGTAPSNGRGVFGGGNTFVGLKSDTLGEFKMGRTDLHYNEFASIEGNRAGSANTAHGAGLMSQVNGTNTEFNPTRTANALWWDSPNWNGITARLGVSTNTTAGEGTGVSTTAGNNPGANNSWTGALRYNNGPITAGLSYLSRKAEGNATTVAASTAYTTTSAATGCAAATATVTSTLISGGGTGTTAICSVATVTAAAAVFDGQSSRLWAGYTFPFGLKVGLGYDNSKRQSRAEATTASARRTSWTLPVTYNTGNHGVYFQYTKANTTAGVTDSNARLYTLGYDYALSKRTAVGAYYTNLRNDAGAAYSLFAVSASGATATTAGQDVSQVYMGVSHSF